MQKIFTIFLMAAMMCASVCGCSSTPAAQEPTPTVSKYEDEDAGAVATTLVFNGDMAALGTAMPTTSIQPEEWSTDYMVTMRQCCLTGDITAGRMAEQDRNEKIAALHLDEPEISFDELYELSKVITNEAGSSWLPMDWKMMIGEIVLNRVASTEFPNTIYEVIHQTNPVQYSGANSSRFENMVPFEDCVDAAIRLLSGERLINDISVVFQSSKRQGGGTYLELYDSYYGYTYLCYSNYPELYE